MQNKKREILSPIKIIIISFLSVIILLSLAVNIVFLHSNKHVDLFGKILYIMPTEEMSTAISANALVVAQPADSESLVAGTIILYSDDSTGIEYTYAARIQNVSAENNTIIYEIKPDSDKITNTAEITADDITGIGTLESPELGKIITFLKSIWGIILSLILPAVIIILIVFIGLLRSRSDADAYFESYSDFDIPVAASKPSSKKSKKPNSVLFEPDESTNTDDDFIARKKSIADNFSQKSPSAPPHRRPKPKKASASDESDSHDDFAGDFSAYKRQNAEAMNAYEKMHTADSDFNEKPYRSAQDNSSIKFIAGNSDSADISGNNSSKIGNPYSKSDDIYQSNPNSSENYDIYSAYAPPSRNDRNPSSNAPSNPSSVDEKAAAIKKALQSRNSNSEFSNNSNSIRQDVQRSESQNVSKSPSQNASNVSKNVSSASTASQSPSIASNSQSPSTASQNPSQSASTASKNVSQSASQNASAKNKYASSYAKKNAPSAKSASASFSDLMKVIDDEQKKLK